MLIVAPLAKDKRTELTNEQQKILNAAPDLRDRVNIPRSEVPAITHVDYSARLQTVDKVRNPRLYDLLSRFLEATGCPVLVNTSFNVRGEPIVCTPEEAYRCFMATEMDVLVLEDCVLLKHDNDTVQTASDREAHLAQFALD